MKASIKIILRYFLELAYCGKKYHGWQIQPEAHSVQAVINNALSTVLRTEINVVGAGRTDTGVHATQMFAHFDFDTILNSNFAFKLNAILPNDIVIYKLIPVKAAAHARFDATSRSYEYRIYLGRNPFLLDTSWQIHSQKLNINEMNKASKILLEYKDFKSFSKVKTDVYTYNCNVTEAFWKQKENQLIFYITANRFLRNMVRAIVGTLIEVGLEKITIQDFKKIIESKNRSNAGLSVPAKGLFLTKVAYPYL